MRRTDGSGEGIKALAKSTDETPAFRSWTTWMIYAVG